MVRLEKLAYETLVNNSQLKRGRQLAAPSKWYTESRHQNQKVAAHLLLHTGITGQIYKALEPLISKLTYQWMRDVGLQRGLAMEDFLLFQDRELRRDMLFETIQRQGFHPYQWVLFRQRRARYYKVERAVRGFFVPDYIRKEAESRLLSDTLVNKEVYEEYVYKNYMSDMTPSTRYTVIPRFQPVEFFNLYGWFRAEAWDRFFYNEVTYENYTKNDLKLAQNPFAAFNLETEAGRKAFETEVNRFAKLYPQTICKEGEQFDFKEFYAMEALVNGKDTTKLDQTVLAKVRGELESYLDDAQPHRQLPSKEKSLVAKVGSVLPAFLLPKRGSLFQ